MRYDVENQERREVWKELRSCSFQKEFLRRAEAGNLADHCHRESNRGGVRALANLVAKFSLQCAH